MKKRPSNVAGLITQVQQQLTYLDKKIDALISQITAKPIEVQQAPKPPERPQSFNRFDRPSRQGEFRQPNNYRERILHKAVCADCRKECEVPFKPSGERPVYCKDCFARRKAGSSFRTNADNRPGEAGRHRERPPYKHAPAEIRRPYAKKKIVRTRKKRS